MISQVRFAVVSIRYLTPRPPVAQLTPHHHQYPLRFYSKVLPLIAPSTVFVSAGVGGSLLRTMRLAPILNKPLPLLLLLHISTCSSPHLHRCCHRPAVVPAAPCASLTAPALQLRSCCYKLIPILILSCCCCSCTATAAAATATARVAGAAACVWSLQWPF